MPAGVAFWIGDEIEYGGVEIEIRLVGYAGVDSFQVDLWGHYEEDAEDNGDHQALKTLRNEVSATAFLKHKEAHGAGDEEQERHTEPGQEEIKFQEKVAGFGVFDVPPFFGCEEHGGVEEEYHDYGQNTQPVEVVPPLDNFHFLNFQPS